MTTEPEQAAEDDALATPYWSLNRADDTIGLWQLVRQLPRTAGPVLAMMWRAAPRYAATITALQVVSGAATALGLLSTTGVLARMLATGPTADRVVAALPTLGIVVGAYALRGAVQTLVELAQARLKPAVSRMADSELLAACLRVDLAAYDDPVFYDRLHRARDHGLLHIEYGVETQVEVISAAVAVVAASVSVGLLHPALLPVLLLGVVPEGWAVLRSARLRHRHMNRTVTMSRRVAMITDLAAQREAAAEIRACQAQAFLRREYRELADALQDQEIRVGVDRVRVQAVGRTLTGVTAGAAFAVLCLLLWSGWIPLAVAGTAAIAVPAASGALRRLVTAANRLFEQCLYVADYQKLLDDARTRTRAAPGRPAPANPGCITLRDVGFRYPAESGHRCALRRINLTIEPGRTIALVGDNGSGKTTLAKVIAGLYPPTTGQIRWDGVDVADLDPETVADRVVMVMQSPVRWPHTARLNVRAGRHDRVDPGDQALRAAARQAGADTVVSGLPRGWDSLLSRHFRNGIELSGGQWQRLAVARGLFRDAPLLIWDEPTAPLDAKAEFAVYESLRRLALDRTVVLITHRLASVRNADHIYLLHEGAIVEHGTHEKLLADKGRYADMYELQARMSGPVPR